MSNKSMSQGTLDSLVNPRNVHRPKDMIYNLQYNLLTMLEVLSMNRWWKIHTMRFWNSLKRNKIKLPRIDHVSCLQVRPNQTLLKGRRPDQACQTSVTTTPLLEQGKLCSVSTPKTLSKYQYTIVDQGQQTMSPRVILVCVARSLTLLMLQAGVWKEHNHQVYSNLGMPARSLCTATSQTWLMIEHKQQMCVRHHKHNIDLSMSLVEQRNSL